MFVLWHMFLLNLLLETYKIKIAKNPYIKHYQLGDKTL